MEEIDMVTPNKLVSRSGSALRGLLLLCITGFMTGCIIPHVDRYHPVQGEKLKTTLYDSQTGQPLKDVQVILVLARQSDYVPDSSGAPKRPRIVVDRFDRLGKLGYTEGGVWIWPFAFGTLYAGTDIFIYKNAYEPVLFKGEWSKEYKFYYPATIKMTPCDHRTGRELAIELAVQKVWKEEWKPYARGVLEKKLRSPPPDAAAQSPATSNLEQRVGQRVELEGFVGNTKCPEVQGVDVWELDAYRGRRVRISGVLRKTVVTEADVDPLVANRGAGTFYSLDDMTYELLK